MPDALVTISVHITIVEAELARGVLDAAGIEAFIHAPHANALYPGALGEIKLQVNESDLEKALEALEEGTVVEEDGDG